MAVETWTIVRPKQPPLTVKGEVLYEGLLRKQGEGIFKSWTWNTRWCKLIVEQDGARAWVVYLAVRDGANLGASLDDANVSNTRIKNAVVKMAADKKKQGRNATELDIWQTYFETKGAIPLHEIDRIENSTEKPKSSDQGLALRLVPKVEGQRIWYLFLPHSMVDPQDGGMDWREALAGMLNPIGRQSSVINAIFPEPSANRVSQSQSIARQSSVINQIFPEPSASVAFVHVTKTQKPLQGMTRLRANKGFVYFLGTSPGDGFLVTPAQMEGTAGRIHYAMRRKGSDELLAAKNVLWTANPDDPDLDQGPPHKYAKAKTNVRRTEERRVFGEKMITGETQRLQDLSRVQVVAALQTQKYDKKTNAPRDYGKAYVVMSLGTDLTSVILAVRDLVAQHKLQEADRVWMGRLLLWELATDLEKCHARRLVHQDLKPGNALMLDSGELVLMDYGACVEEGKDISGCTRFFMPAYWQAKDMEDRKGLAANDLYALAKVWVMFMVGAAYRGEFVDKFPKDAWKTKGGHANLDPAVFAFLKANVFDKDDPNVLPSFCSATGLKQHLAGLPDFKQTDVPVLRKKFYKQVMAHAPLVEQRDMARALLLQARALPW